ncbi:MAG: MerR family transcriptional regulator [Bacteriovoracales bacterium]|nr:MerR family transcriptional regulator [Bacteriovoracales bacterium]
MPTTPAKKETPSFDAQGSCREIPNKSCFRPDEVCRITGIKPYILRFWESEFDDIDPMTSASGQKIYEHKDIEVIKQIKSLVIDEKLTIEKAKALLSKKIKSLGSSKDHDRHFLSITDLEKLLLAKTKLQNIISKTQSMQNLLNDL